MNETFELWSGWQILEEIGRGENGCVYKIRNTNNPRAAVSALKVITLPKTDQNIGHYSDWQPYSDNAPTQSSVFDIYSDQIKQIGKTAAYLTHNPDHPNIVKLHEYKIQHSDDRHSWRILLRTELLTPLSAYCTAHPMTEAEVVNLGIAVCRALEDCHANGIIHRNIKTENLFVDNARNFKLGDIGTTTVSDGNTSVSISRTESFLAPEIYYQVKHDHTVDIYSLGMIMYRLMNGQQMPLVKAASGTPTDAELTEAQYRRYRSDQPLPAPAHASEKLAAIIIKACSHTPENRFSTAAELRQALEALTAPTDPTGKQIPPKPKKPAGNPAAQGTKNNWQIPIIITLCVLVVILAVLLLLRGCSTPPSTDYPNTDTPSAVISDTLPQQTAESAAAAEPAVTAETEEQTTAAATEAADLTETESAAAAEITVSSVSVSTMPTVTQYYVGDKLNTNGLSMKISYSDGSTKTVTSGFTCSPTTLSSVGSQKITVSLNGKTTTFTVQVKQKSAEVKPTETQQTETQPTQAEITVKSISVASNPTKTQYTVGDKLNTSGLSLKISYSDGSSKTVSSGFTCSPTTLSSAGSQKITVSLYGKTTTFTVQVKQNPSETKPTETQPTKTEVTVKSIAVAAMPTQTQYTVGDKLNTSGLSLKISYSDGSSKTVSSGFTCSPTTLSTAGSQNITVSLNGKTTTFTVQVKAPVTLIGISVAQMPYKTEYTIGDTFDAAGLVLLAKYSDGTESLIKSGYECFPTVLDTVGFPKVYAEYASQLTSFTVTVSGGVIAPNPEIIEPNPGEVILPNPEVIEPNPEIITPDPGAVILPNS